MPKQLAILLAMLAVTLATLAARAQTSDRSSCMLAYEQGQRLRRQGALLESRDQLLVCARAPCPQSLQSDCIRWLGEVEHLVPSIVVVVRRADGVDVNDARVFVDGHLQVGGVAGLGTDVDPGERTVRVELGALVLEQNVLVRVAEKGRPIRFEVSAPDAPPPLGPPGPPPPPPPSHRPVGWSTLVLGGISVVALGAFAGFAIDGESRYSRLERCRPACNPDDVDAARSSYRNADIAVAVAMTAVAAGIVTFVMRPTVFTSSAPILRTVRICDFP